MAEAEPEEPNVSRSMQNTCADPFIEAGTQWDNDHDGSGSNAISFFRSLTFDQGGNRERGEREKTNMGVEMMEATKLREITGRIFVEVVLVEGHSWMIVT